MTIGSFCSVLLTPILAFAVGFSGLAQAADAQDRSEYDRLIEDVLIEVIEVKTFTSEIALEAGVGRVVGLGSALEEAKSDISNARSFPKEGRYASILPRSGDALVEQARTNANVQIVLALETLQKIETQVQLVSDSLSSTLQHIRDLDDSITSPGYGPTFEQALLAARQGLNDSVDSLSWTGLSEMKEAISSAADHLKGDQAEDSSDAAGFSAARSDLVKATDELRSSAEILLDVTSLTNQVGNDLAEAALAGLEEPDQASLGRGSESLFEGRDSLALAISASRELGSSLINATRSSVEGESAADGVFDAILAPPYGAVIDTAQTSASEAAAVAEEIEAELKAGMGRIEAALSSADEVWVDDPRVRNATIALTSQLRTAHSLLGSLLAELSGLEAGIRTINRFAAQIQDSDGQLVSSATLEAVIQAFDRAYESDPFVSWSSSAAILDEEFWTTYRLAQSALSVVGSGVELAVTAVDQVQSDVEGRVWGAAEDAVGGPSVVNPHCTTDNVDGVIIYYGDAGPNTCTGTSGPDIFWVRGGNDYAYGRDGHDQIHLGSGEDYGYGEDGPDHIWGGMHSDRLAGSNGDDVLEDNAKTSDANYFTGGPGVDKANMIDGDENDSFFSGTGVDPKPERDEVCWEFSCFADYWEQ